MLRQTVTFASVTFCGLLAAAAVARADEDHSGRTVRRDAVAIQTITILDHQNNPLLALGLPLKFELVAEGGLLFDFEPGGREFLGQAEFTGDFPIPFVLASDAFPGTLTKAGNAFKFEAVAPFYLTTTVQVAPGVFVPARLFTLEDAVFTATLHGRGFRPGTTFVSPESVALGMELDFGGGEVVVFEDGDGNPLPVATSSDRTVEIVAAGE